MFVEYQLSTPETCKSHSIARLVDSIDDSGSIEVLYGRKYENVRKQLKSLSRLTSKRRGTALKETSQLLSERALNAVIDHGHLDFSRENAASVSATITDGFFLVHSRSSCGAYEPDRARKK